MKINVKKRWITGEMDRENDKKKIA